MASNQNVVDDLLREYAYFAADRTTFEGHWNEVAELVMPEFKNTFYQGSYNTPGEKKTERQFDANAALALSRFGAILDSLLTPRTSFWHKLEASDPQLQKDRTVKLWYDEVTRRLFRARYAPTANFSSQNQAVYKSLGSFGTGPMFVDKLMSNDGTKGIRYKAMPLGEVYLRENHQGMVDGFFRRFRLTAQQAANRKDWQGVLPQAILDKARVEPNCLYTFIHCVKPRDDYDPERLDAKGKLFGSWYIQYDYRCMLTESGYNSFPMPASRYDQAPGEIYGRGPAMMVLPAIKVLNTEKKMMLKQGHRALDPVLLMADDGAAAFSQKPGAQNPGTVNADGRPMVVPLPSGQIQIGLEMMQEERQTIDGAFLVDLFKLLLDDPKVFSATQVQEMAAQRGILIAPTVGRQQSEYLGPLIDRELDVLADLGMLPEMPGLLREAAGEYQTVYTSPLSRAARAQEAAGLWRTVESSLTVVNVTQNPAPLDHFNWDVIIPETADINGVPERWMRAADEVAQIRNGRQDQQQQQQTIQAMPGVAALAKAQNQAAGKGGK